MDLPKSNKTILHIDLNSFFASAEQQANPFLRNKSMGVGNRSYENSAVLAASYPAKAKGIGLSTRLREAKAIDPKFELAELDPVKYYDLHNKFIEVLNCYTPLIEIYSIDEAFLDFSFYKSSQIEDICFSIKDDITKNMGEAITCSIGIGGNKLLAKIGSNYDKPDGITNIRWEDRFKFLDSMELEKVWGIGRRVSKKMNSQGIYRLGQIKKMSDQELYSIVGSYYTRLKLISHGYNFEPFRVGERIKPPQSMQHAHTLCQATKDPETIAHITRKMAERLAIRLRRHRQKAKGTFLGLAPVNEGNYGWGYTGWMGENYDFDIPTDNGYTIYQKCKQAISRDRLAKPVRRVVVGLFNLTLPDQISFNDLNQDRERKLDEAFDLINNRFGQFTIRTADILNEHAKESELEIDRHDMRFHTV